MHTLTDRLLVSADRLTARLGPVASLMETMLERLAPQAAAAACSGCYCGESVQVCTWLPSCAPVGGQPERFVKHYSSTCNCAHIDCNVYLTCFC